MTTSAQNANKAVWIRNGGYSYVKDLLQVGNDAKTILGEKHDVMTGILYLAPAAQNPHGVNLCPMAKLAKCEKPCLFTAGRGGMSNVEMGRLGKTNWFITDQEFFMETLAANIERLIRAAKRKNMKLAIRLNGTSDILWERIAVRGKANVMELFPTVQFYDYTKRPNRVVPSNYHLTFSYSGSSKRYSEMAMEQASKGYNVAVVFRSEEKLADVVGKTFRGIPVIDGSCTDIRFGDAPNSVIGLCAKGPAKKDNSGFVVDV